MKGKFKRNKFYCNSCDRAIVAGGKKCPICKQRNYGIKIKKKLYRKDIDESLKT